MPWLPSPRLHALSFWGIANGQGSSGGAASPHVPFACRCDMLRPGARTRRRRDDPWIAPGRPVRVLSSEESGAPGAEPGGLIRVTPGSYCPLTWRASRSSTRARRAAIPVAPVAVIASRFASRPPGRRSMTATCQRATSPWYVHGPTAPPDICARASWTAAQDCSRSSSVTMRGVALIRAPTRALRLGDQQAGVHPPRPAVVGLHTAPVASALGDNQAEARIQSDDRRQRWVRRGPGG